MLVGNLVAGKRIAQAIGRELGVVEDQDLIRKVPFFTSFAKTNRTAKIFKDQENRSNDILFQHIVNERGSGRIVMF